jgi:hypothetical protein
MVDIKAAWQDFRANREALNEAKTELEAVAERDREETDEFLAANQAVDDVLDGMPWWQR